MLSVHAKTRAKAEGALCIDTHLIEALIAQEVTMTVARAGSPAPQFSGMAFVDGGFKKVSLSDYAGKWTVICFYPGDFTFV